MTGKGTIDVSLRAYGAILLIPLIAERSREKREIQEPQVRGGVRGGAHRFPRFFRFCLMMNAKSAIMTKWLNVFENQRRESDWLSWRLTIRRWIIPTRRASSPRRNVSKMQKSAACGCWSPQTACRAKACRRLKRPRRKRTSAWRLPTARWNAFPKGKLLCSDGL